MWCIMPGNERALPQTSLTGKSRGVPASTLVRIDSEDEVQPAVGDGTATPLPCSVSVARCKFKRMLTIEQLALALSMAFSQFASSNVRVWSLVFQALRSPRGERESSTSVGVWV